MVFLVDASHLRDIMHVKALINNGIENMLQSGGKQEKNKFMVRNTKVIVAKMMVEFHSCPSENLNSFVTTSKIIG